MTLGDAGTGGIRLVRKIVFRLLGTLDVQVDGERVALGSARQRIVLTTLLLAPNRVVSVDSLIEAVWQGREPTTARNQIAICVGALRKIFKEAAGVDDLIVTSHPGYILSTGEHRVDVREFEEWASRARDAARRGQAAEAGTLVEEALSLWRGRALEGIDSEVAESAAARLEELRLDLREERAGLQLQLGRHRALIGELSALVRENPLREQARAFLMLAEYRSGRRAKALEIFREGRDILVDQLGIEPGPALQSLHDLVLQDSPDLAQPAVDAAPAADHHGALPTPREHSGVHRADGRTRRSRPDAGRQLRLAPLAVGVVAGVAGVGKTALAVHWANQVAARFPDGRLLHRPARIRREGRPRLARRRPRPAAALAGCARPADPVRPHGPGRPLPQRARQQADADPARQRPLLRAGALPAARRPAAAVY